MIPDNKITDAVLNHIWGITCAVATVTGIPFFYDLLAKTDLNTDAARTIITLAGVIASGVSFALGWNQRNISARRESAALRIENTSIRSEVERRPGYFERRRIEREKREREERERIEKEERDRRLRRNFVLGLDSNMKSFLYEIAEYDSVEVPLNDDHIKELRSRLSLMGECAIECTNVGTRDGDKYWRVSLSDLGKQVVAECPNILKEAKDFESR